MGLFSTKKKQIDPELVGRWDADLSDNETKNIYGDARMLFDEAGNLAYVINEAEKQRVIRFVYWVKDGILFSDQPSAPKEVQTKYSFEDKENLLLELEGTKSRFKRHYYEEK